MRPALSNYAQQSFKDKKSGGGRANELALGLLLMAAMARGPRFALAKLWMSKGRGETIAVILIGTLGLHSGCATSKPDMASVRTDGRRILDDPALLKKGETDIALCNANLDSGAVDEGARKCMGLKGYALVPKAQAEDARAGFAAAQRASTPSSAPDGK
jgi:hypothetical protein